MSYFAKRLPRSIIFCAVLLVSFTNVRAQNNPIQLATLSIPTGIATDAQGNVFVISTSAFKNYLVKIDPDGEVLATSELDYFAQGHIVFDPQTRWLWHLWSTGEIALSDPTTGVSKLALNLKQMNIEVDQVYDIETGIIQDFGALLLPDAAQTTYGDIALLRRGKQLDLLISGVSIAHPFVLRLRIVENQVKSAKVIVSSLSSGAPLNNLPRGVAVSLRGTVLTAFPREGTDQLIIDHAVTFSVDFPEKPIAANLPRILFTSLRNYSQDGADFTATGMAADAKGNFYIATGQTGTSLCSGGSGELARIDARFRRITCSQIDSTILNSQDVAIDEANGFAYMTVLGWGSDTTGQVIRFDLP